MPYDVRGKIALITGASSGFGKGLAERLAERGSKLILSDVNDKAGNEVTAALNRVYGANTAIYIHCDVSKSDELKNLFAKGIQHYGGLDICVNNAGIAELGKFVSDPDCNWKKVMDIDLYAVIEGTQLAMNQMRTQSPRGGVIINVASMAGFLPSIDMPIYVAAKFGVVGFTRSLSRRLVATQGIRVVGIAPTYAETPLVTNAKDVDE
ncbi:hypothetical protein HDU76_010756, partial [Blyttiomyces sp. JEL0837]